MNKFPSHCCQKYGENVMLFHISEKEPPKNEPFLALTIIRFEMMEWKERIVDGENKGWYGFYCPCACCNGYCSDKFEYWMLLPSSPEIIKKVEE